MINLNEHTKTKSKPKPTCKFKNCSQLSVLSPNLPYFTEDPVFQHRSPGSREEAAQETASPVFDYRLIGRIYKLCLWNLHHASIVKWKCEMYIEEQ